MSLITVRVHLIYLCLNKTQDPTVLDKKKIHEVKLLLQRSRAREKPSRLGRVELPIGHVCFSAHLPDRQLQLKKKTTALVLFRDNPANQFVIQNTLGA